MLPEASTYEELASRFSWDIPDDFNIGTAVCDAWADREPDREALVFAEEGGESTSYSYADLKRHSNWLANLFASRGVQPGDRVGVLLPQAPETAFAHIAALKLGAITIPLFTLFGDEALSYRLGNSGAKVVVTFKDGSTLEEEIAVAAAHPRGARPFAREDYVAKFETLTDGLVEPAESERFLAAAAGLTSDVATDLGAITVEVPQDRLERSGLPGLFG